MLMTQQGRLVCVGSVMEATVFLIYEVWNSEGRSYITLLVNVVHLIKDFNIDM